MIPPVLLCAEQRVVEIPKAASVSATRRGETRVHLGPGIHVFLHSSPAGRSLPNDDLWRGPEPQIPQNAKNCFPCSRESSRPGEARRAVESDSSVLRCRTGVPATSSIPSLTHAQNDSFETRSDRCLRHTAHRTFALAQSRDGLPCAQDSLVARVQRSISLPSRRLANHVSDALAR